MYSILEDCVFCICILFQLCNTNLINMHMPYFYLVRFLFIYFSFMLNKNHRKCLLFPFRERVEIAKWYNYCIYAHIKLLNHAKIQLFQLFFSVRSIVSQSYSLCSLRSGKHVQNPIVAENIACIMCTPLFSQKRFLGKSAHSISNVAHLEHYINIVFVSSQINERFYFG